MGIIEKAPGVLLVSDVRELKDAYATLAGGRGGRIELEASDQRYAMSLGGKGDGAVTISSEDPDNPAILSQLRVAGVENLTVSDVVVNGMGVERDYWISDFRVADSRNVEISNVEFLSDAGGFAASGSSVPRGGALGNIENGSTGIVFTDNLVTGYFHGIGVFNSDKVTISDSEITRIQGDGIRMAGSHDVTISGNWLHDFFGSSNDLNHDDMIQVWGLNTDRVMKNLKIEGNFLDSGEGTASQSILIQNEARASLGRHENIEITDNVIRNGHVWGVGVNDTDGVLVANNTLLWNPGSVMYSTATDEDGSTSQPVIRIASTVSGGRVIDNISNLSFGDGASVELSGNMRPNYTDPANPAFIGNNFINALDFGAVSLRDLRLLPDSIFAGAGSSLTEARTTTEDGVEAIMSIGTAIDDRYRVTLDAGLSIDEDGSAADGGTEFVWIFDDGTTLKGEQVDRLFDGAGDYEVTLRVMRDGKIADEITRGLEVGTKDLATIDFSGGLADLSSRDSKIGGSGTLAEGSEGRGYQIGGTDKLSLSRDNGHIHSLDTFGLSFDMRLADADDAGIFLDFYNVFRGHVLDDGSIRFRLRTDEGSVSLDSDRPVLDADGFTRIGIAYDGVAGQLGLFADGEKVGEAELTGQTAAKSYYGLDFGAVSWERAVAAVIDEIAFSADPGVAGELPAKPVTGESSDAADKDPVDPAPAPEVPDQPEAPEEDPSMPPLPGAGGAQEEAGALVQLSFDGDLTDDAGGLTNLSVRGGAGNAAYRWDGDDGRYLMTGDNSLSMSRNAGFVYERDDFRIGLSLQKQDADGSGSFLHLHETLQALVSEEDELIFKLQTDKGNFVLTSDEGAISDTEEHAIDFLYDGSELSMVLDGEIVAETQAEGTTAPVKYWGLTIGKLWHSSLEASVDDFIFADNLG